jgi:hypothetical protein
MNEREEHFRSKPIPSLRRPARQSYALLVQHKNSKEKNVVQHKREGAREGEERGTVPLLLH